MKQLEKDLKAITRDLKKLTQITATTLRQLENLGKVQAAKKSKTKAGKKGTKGTATNTVLSIVRRYKKGVDTATLKNRTGFDEKKIWNIINALKKQGKIKSGGRGIYVKK